MDIGAWLRGLGMERYIEAFEENAVDERVLPRLTGEDLKEIGVAAVGHRRMLLDAIAALGGDGGPAPAGEQQAEPGGERRQVSVLFADLAGFTALSSELDAEEVHALLDAFFAVADQAVIDHGGTVDKHIGDCVMGVFGAPVAHGNDPERAVRAAIAIRDGAAKLIGKVGRAVRIHVGVASGEVVAAQGGEAHREYTVTGESVNLASRLADRARADEILISDSVHKAVAGRMLCEAAGTFELKGFAEPLNAWRVQQVSAATAEQARPFVGRASEIRQFAAALEGCSTTRSGQTILVRGEPGIGKSRLTEEFRRLATEAGFATFQGLVLDFGGDNGRAALSQLAAGLFRRQFGPQAAETSEVADQAMSEAGIAAAERAVIFDLLDMTMPAELRPGFDALDRQARQRHGRLAMIRLVENACRKGPLLLVVEDIHWADDSVLDILSAIAGTTSEQPVQLVVTTRADADPSRQGWSAGGPLMTLDLAPLSRNDALALAENYFDAAAAQVEACVQRASGNPLFLDQLLQHAQSKAQGAVPDSVQSLVQARMDQLAPREKKALQTASVLGQTFRLEALRHLLDDSSFECTALVQRRLVRPQDDGFIFSHALIRDAAYGTLLRNRRRELHRRAAEWLRDRDFALTAEHLALAGDKEAPAACLSAARSLAARYRFEQALALTERGLGVESGGDAAFDLRLLRADLLLQTGETNAALEAFAAAAEIASRAQEQCRSLLGLASARRISDDLDKALEDTQKGIEIAVREGLLEDAARGYGLLGNLLFPRGDVDGCLAAHSKSLELARKAGSVELEASALGGLGDVEYLRGNSQEACRRFGQCLELARAHKLRRTELANMPMYAISKMWLSNLEDVRALALDAVGAAASIGFDRAEMVGHHAAYFAFVNLNRPQEALHHAELATSLARRLNAPRFEAEGLAFEAEALFELDRIAEARAKFHEALAIGRKSGMRYMGPIFLGGCALVAQTDEELAALVKEGEELLADDVVSHNHSIFRIGLINVCRRRRDWGGMRHHAAALAEFLDGRNVRGLNLVIEGALALADFGEGEPEARGKLVRLAGKAREHGYERLVRDLESALDEHGSARGAAN